MNLRPTNPLARAHAQLRYLLLLCTVSLSISSTLFAANTCGTATALSIGTSAAGDFTAATASGSDECGNGALSDLWYTFTATQSTHNVRVDEPGDDFSNTIASVYAGTCASLTVVECGFQGYLFLTGLTAGNDYLLQIQLLGGVPQATTFDVIVEVPPAPPTNDAAPSATSLTLGAAPTLGTLYGATDSNENTCTPGNNDEDDDVFFTFVAPASGQVDVSLTQLSGSDPLPITSLLSIDQATSSLVCEQETFDLVNSYTGLTPGALHYIQVYSLFEDPQTTTFNIEVSETASAPSNDECAAAIGLTVGTATSATVEGATSSGVDPCASASANDDVWFSFIATDATQEVYVTPTASPGSGLIMGVHEGACGSLTNVECTTTANAPALLSGLTVGDTYLVQVYSVSAAGGEQIEFDIEVVAPPANDDCTNATALACGASVVGDMRGASSHEGSPSCAETGIWFELTGTGGQFTLTATPAAGVDVAIEIYRGNCGSLTSLVCEDFGLAGEADEAIFQTLVDQKYYAYIGESVFDFGKGLVTVALSCAAPTPIASASGCSGTTTVNFTGANAWRHLNVGGGIAASIFDSEALGDVDITLYGHTGSTRTATAPYADRNVTIVPTTQPSLPIQVRLYYTADELNDLIAADPNVSSISDLGFTKVSGTSCSAAFPSGASQVQLPVTASGSYLTGYYLQTSVASFSEFFVSSGATVLPAELTHFTAFAKTGGHHLEWTSATETNVDRYFIERSVDGRKFALVGTVEAIGSRETEQAYSYTDAGFDGDAYYRLMILDLDGTSEQSETVFVEAASHSGLELSAYPNPATDRLTVQARGAANYALIDAVGRIAISGDLDSEATQLDVSRLPVGTYTLLVTSDHARSTQRVIVAR